MMPRSALAAAERLILLVLLYGAFDDIALALKSMFLKLPESLMQLSAPLAAELVEVLEVLMFTLLLLLLLLLYIKDDELMITPPPPLLLLLLLLLLL
jgi:ABC-type anion transport system duplicated permease subunit